MAPFLPSLLLLLAASCLVGTVSARPRVIDLPDVADNPCKIGESIWVTPRALRACFRTHPLNETIRANVIEVLNKTLAFHSSVNYQRLAPSPFSAYVHEDILTDLSLFSGKKYDSEYDFHLDISAAVNRMQDGHLYWTNACYDSVFINYLPTPLSLITGTDGRQNIHIAYEAFAIFSNTSNFEEVRDDWQDALPGDFKGKMETLSGAKILEINGKEPFAFLEEFIETTGNFPAKSIRQNVFFGHYTPTGSWRYKMGTFASQNLPLNDEVTFRLVRVNHTVPEVVNIPYYAYNNQHDFSDTASWRQRTCTIPTSDNINGVDLYKTADPQSSTVPILKPQKQIMNQHHAGASDGSVPTPAKLLPPNQIFSQGPASFHTLNGNRTGILALGDFLDPDTSLVDLNAAMLKGLKALKRAGAEQLILDLTSNKGGYICAGAFLYRILVGPSAETLLGLDGTVRVNPLSQAITKNIAENNVDPKSLLHFNPRNLAFPNGTAMPANYDWLKESNPTVVNGHQDAFSQRLGTNCHVNNMGVNPPTRGLFDPKTIVIIGNGFCGSTCAMFSAIMAKKEGVKTLIVGGVAGVAQEYAGSPGGESLNFQTLQTEIKTAKLGDHPLAPPDLLVRGDIGINWRLAYGVVNKDEPEEWQSRPADYVLPITADIVANPLKIWEAVEAKVFH